MAEEPDIRVVIAKTRYSKNDKDILFDEGITENFLAKTLSKTQDINKLVSILKDYRKNTMKMYAKDIGWRMSNIDNLLFGKKEKFVTGCIIDGPISRALQKWEKKGWGISVRTISGDDFWNLDNWYSGKWSKY